MWRELRINARFSGVKAPAESPPISDSISTRTVGYFHLKINQLWSLANRTAKKRVIDRFELLQDPQKKWFLV